MQNIDKAASLIRSGDLVAFPTETVYGLGANALDDQACQKIYAAKGRPSHNPLIVHVADINQAKQIGIFNQQTMLLTEIWPGPLTIVVPKNPNSSLAKSVTGGLDTVAIRIPAHPIALELIKRSGLPIAAPSANLSGKLSPTSSVHVQKNFGGSVFVLESDEPTRYGLESTIIDMSTNTPTILRFGFITPEFLEDILDQKIAIASESSSIKAPGMMLSHYAPHKNLRLNAATIIAENEVGLNFSDSKLLSPGSLNLSVKGDLAEAASKLFDFLHQLDLLENYSTIAVAHIPNIGIGLAINDRLKRAAKG